MTKYMKAIDEQRVASLENQKGFVKEYTTMIESNLKYNDDMKVEWKEKFAFMVDEFRSLKNTTANIEEIREDMKEQMRKEKIAYRRSQRKATRHFEKQMARMERLISSHTETTQLTISGLTQAVEDIRRQLRDMSRQLLIYLNNQAKLIK